MKKNNSNLLIVLGLIFCLFTGWMSFVFLNIFPNYRDNIMTNDIMQLVYFLGLYIFMALISYIIFIFLRTLSLSFIRFFKK